MEDKELDVIKAKNGNGKRKGIVLPAVTPEEAVESWNKYLALKQKIATNEDTQDIQGRTFYKKSYWRKLATFFNLTIEVIKEEKEAIGDNVAFYFTCQATAPNGRSVIGTGSCDLKEKKNFVNTLHNARSTAETRAFNRAISNLVGGGEVSFEEMGDQVEEKATAKPKPAPTGRGNLCSKCNNPIDRQAVIDFSIQKFGKPVNWNCQKGINPDKPEQSEGNEVQADFSELNTGIEEDEVI